VFEKRKRPRTIKALLLAVIGITIAGIIVVFIGYRRIMQQHEALLAPLEQKADIAIESFEQTATKNGVKEWHLRARSARYQKANQEAVLEDLTVIFFLKDGDQAHLTADRGTVLIKSNDLTVSGNVIADNGHYQLKSQEMHYQHDQRILLSRVPVEISGPGFHVMADSIRFDLNTHRTLLEGNVDARFSGKLAL
jgi:lipopolysaccharide export system protein LptC